MSPLDPRDSGRWRRLRKQLRDQATHCARCSVLLVKTTHRSPHSAQVDHITPIVAGGDPFNPGNLRVICARCNSSTGATMGNRLRQPRTPTTPIRGSQRW